MFIRRLVIFLLLFAFGVTAVIIRLAHMQLGKGQEYARAADETLKTTRWLATHRGEILDRNGKILAIDQPCFEFTMAYPALLISWASRQSAHLMEEHGLSDDQADNSVRKQLVDAHEDQIMQSWAKQQAKATVRRQGHDLTPRQRDHLRAQVLESLPARIEWTLNAAAATAGVSRQEVDEEIDRIVQRVWRVRAMVRMQVEEEKINHGIIHALDETTAVALRGQLGDMLGADVSPSSRRWYRYGASACHVIGLTGPVGPDDVGLLWVKEGQEDPNTAAASRNRAAATQDFDPNDLNVAPQLPPWPCAKEIASYTKADVRPEGTPGHEEDVLGEYLPDERAGILGAERMAEPVLRGTRGRQVRQRSGKVLELLPSIGGQNVRLTLDIDLQQAVETQILDSRPENGAAVVIDIPTSQILVLASKPRYDLNTYRAKFESLWDDQTNLPLLDRAVSCAFPPGSTVKPIVALTAALNGTLTPESVIECRGYFSTPEAKNFRCWIYKGRNGKHGLQTMQEALKNSCNIYFETAAERLGEGPLLDGMRLFGLGQRPLTLLPQEHAGNVPTTDWMWRHVGHDFNVADVRVMGIGQGKLLATPLQIANVMATIGRGGIFTSPLLVMGTEHNGEEGPLVRRDLHLPLEALAAVQAGMFDVVNDPYGTAHKHAYDPAGPVICGKTGTAQTTARQVDHKDVLQGDTAWFAGYAPRQDPKIAFAIVMEYTSGGGGGEVCGPLARELVRMCQEKGYLH